MSEMIADSGFTSQGFDSSTSFYGEDLMMHDYATVDTSNLEARAVRFANISLNQNTIPKHRALADRYLAHIAFELGYRDGAV